MPDALTSSALPLYLSIAACCALTLAGMLRIWCWPRRMPAGHANTRTARRFALGFVCASTVWLAYALWKGYGRFVQPDWQRQLVIYADALWTLPLFTTAIVWGAGWAVLWVLRTLEREARQSAP